MFSTEELNKLLRLIKKNKLLLIETDVKLQLVKEYNLIEDSISDIKYYRIVICLKNQELTAQEIAKNHGISTVSISDIRNKYIDNVEFWTSVCNKLKAQIQKEEKIKNGEASFDETIDQIVLILKKNQIETRIKNVIIRQITGKCQTKEEIKNLLIRFAKGEKVFNIGEGKKEIFKNVAKHILELLFDVIISEEFNLMPQFIKKKIKISLLHKKYIAEELALKFYKNAGYEINHKIEDFYMHNSKHHEEIMYLHDAYLAIDYFCECE